MGSASLPANATERTSVTLTAFDVARQTRNARVDRLPPSAEKQVRRLRSAEELIWALRRQGSD
jgi:hypothetical protein